MFKVGDKVKCIDPGPFGNNLIRGKLYEVVWILNEIDDVKFIRVNNNKENIVLARRFTLFEEMEGPKMSYKNLYDAAKAAKIRNRSKMNKAQLIAALNNVQLGHLAAKPAPKEVPVQVPEKERAIMPAPVPLGNQLRQKVEKANPREICSFALKYVDRKEPEFHVSAYCHANLMRSNSGIEILVEDVARHVNKHSYKEAYKEYLDYLINRSPHAPNFITKSVDEAIEGGLYLNTNGLHSRVVASIVASREGSEFPHRVDTFKKLKDLGVSENVSWFLANFLYPRSINTYYIEQMSQGHCVLNYAMSYPDICKFFKEGFHTKINDQPMNQRTGQYQIFKSIADIHIKDASINVFSTLTGVMGEKPRSGFGHITLEYTLEQLKPLIEKVEKDFS